MRPVRRGLAAAFLIAARCLGLSAQAAEFEPGITAIEALVRVRGAIGAAVEAGDAQGVRAWVALCDRGLPDKAVLWLRPAERLLLAFWLEEPRRALDLLEARPAGGEQRLYLPPDDQLFGRLREAGAARRDQLKAAVRASGLPEEQRYFLLLVLGYLLKVDPMSQEEQLDLNRAAAYFNRRFPRSRHREYVNREIVAPVPRPSALAVGIDGGATCILWLGEWGSNLHPGWGSTFGVDASFRRLVVYLRTQMANSPVRREFSAGGTWPAGSTAGVFAAEIGAGCLVVASRRVKLAPFAGYERVSLDPVAGEAPMPSPPPSLRFSAAAAGLDLDVLLFSRRFGTSLGAPQTSLVLRTRAVAGGEIPPRGDQFELTTASLGLSLQLFVRPQRLW